MQFYGFPDVLCLTFYFCDVSETPDGLTDGPTVGQTDKVTDKASYRDANIGKCWYS